ncbi:uncharacterized protein LOC143988608 [Lithobates pipiens]
MHSPFGPGNFLHNFFAICESIGKHYQCHYLASRYSFTCRFEIGTYFFRQGPDSTDDLNDIYVQGNLDSSTNELSIINLSSQRLSEPELEVLKLGLTFCPDSNTTKFQLIKDLHLFARRLLYRVIFDKPVTPDFDSNDNVRSYENMTEHYAIKNLMELWEEGNTDDDDSEAISTPSLSVPGVSFPPPPSFKCKSRAFPLLNANPNIWAFIQQTTIEIEKLSFHSPLSNNLSLQHRAAIKSLQKNTNLIIKPADKGGNLVIMEVVQYTSMCRNILSNRNWYRPISKTVILNYRNIYLNLIFKAYQQGVIDLNTWKFLNIKDPKIPTFYALPKIHKSQTNPPGRPIISGCSCLTENASALVDSYLSPHVISLSSYVKDTIDLLRMIEGLSLPPNSWLVALDIESLYNTIPHDKGVEVVRRFLSERGSSFLQYSSFVVDLLEYILKHNVFVFDSTHYLQVQGVAMGTKCAPSYANLYLGGWEKETFSREDLSPFLDKIISWFRYIDDVLFFWAGTETELKTFFQLISINNFNLKFTMQHSQSIVNFLDITISVDSEGRLNSLLFRKPSAGNTVLHATSFHPISLINSIPYSQYLRLKRNCSKNSDFNIAADDLYQRLRKRGYSHKCLKRAYNRVKPKTRTSLIFSTRRPNTNDSVRIITRYSNQHRKFKEILHKFWPLLLADPITKKHIKNFPEVTFKRVPSLKDKLVHSHFEQPKLDTREVTSGTFPCGHCDVCCYVNSHTKLKLPNGKWHSIKHRVTCQTQGVIYLARCLCGGFYVGKTKRQFCIRIKDHIKPIIKKKMETAISRHVGLFHAFNPKFITFSALEHIPLDVRGGSVDNILLQHEAEWIFNLRATIPPGFNENLSFKPFL